MTPPADSTHTSQPIARSVAVGPFQVLDATSEQLVETVVAGALRSSERPFVAAAAHVAALNALDDPRFVRALRAPDVVYADGMSVVLLARLAGARQIQRSVTTDVGWACLEGLQRALGRPLRLALVGGPAGLAQEAAQVFTGRLTAQVVLTTHGFHEDWQGVLADLRAADCDAVVVGLGCPAEHIWVDEHLRELPPCLVLTCGGWFGYLVGDEARAPLWLQRHGGEWLYRLRQAPRRLAGRYARGAVRTTRVAWSVWRRRLTR